MKDLKCADCGEEKDIDHDSNGALKICGSCGYSWEAETE